MFLVLRRLAQAFLILLGVAAITFVLLYALMAKWALPRVGKVIDNRQKLIEGDLTEANRLKQESDEAVAAYEKALAEARARAQSIANETREKQQAESDVARKTLEGGLNAKLAAAEKSIAATKTAAMANVRSIAEDAARAIVERLIGAAPSEKAVADAVTDVLKR